MIRKCSLLSSAVLLTLIFTGNAQAQDTATVYFYRPERVNEYGVLFKMYEGDRFIEWLWGESVLRYTCNAGRKVFVAKTKSGNTSSINITLGPGETYFIRCVATRLEDVKMEIDTYSDAETRVSHLNIKDIRNVNTRTPREDTVRAVRNLFYRKSHGGRVRALAANLAILQALYGISYAYTSNTTTNSVTGTTTTNADTDLITVFVVEAVIALGVSISGVIQRNEYSRAKMTRLVNAYESGLPLPPLIKSKLQPRDFY